MNEKNLKRAYVQAVTDDALTKKYLDDLGHKALVKRESVSANELTDQLDEVMKDIGRNIQEVGSAPRGMQYKGSIACHIYTSEIMKESAFYCQFAIEEGTHPALIEASAIELRGQVAAFLGKTQPKKRSGFSG